MLRLIRSTIKNNFLSVTYILLAYIVTVVLFLLVIVVNLFVYLIYKITFIIGMHRKKYIKSLVLSGISDKYSGSWKISPRIRGAIVISNKNTMIIDIFFFFSFPIHYFNYFYDYIFILL